MSFIGIILLVIFVIVALLLVGIVLLQDEQGEGLGGIFGGGSTTPFGSRSGNVLTKTTSILAAVFLVTSFVLVWLNTTGGSEDVLSSVRTERQIENWWEPAEEEPGSDESE